MTARPPPVVARVVFLPGTLGSVLVDQRLTPEQARQECERNLGPARDRRWRGRSYYPCNKRPETLWGAIGSLHWFFNPSLWFQRLTRGNGYDQQAPLDADSLVDIDLLIGRRRVQVRPYAQFLKALRDAGADVLVVPYDWRLSNRHNARLLERRILERWFGGRRLPRKRRLRQEERITFIGHSMGGLIARSFLESTPLGPVVGRRLITIGTPHRGAPLAYLHLIGRTLPFPESPFSSWAHATLVRESRAAGIAVQGELVAQLIPRRIQTALVRFMASTFELLPSYNFVTSRGRTESYADTYANEVHGPRARRPSRSSDVFARPSSTSVSSPAGCAPATSNTTSWAAPAFRRSSAMTATAPASSRGGRATARCRLRAPACCRRAPATCG